MTAGQVKCSRMRSRPASPSRRRSSASPEQPLERGPQRADVARRHEQPGLAVDDQVEQPADRARDHRPAVGHRLGAGDAEALAVRRHRDHGGPLVQRRQLVVRHEPERRRARGRAAGRRPRSSASSPRRPARARGCPSPGESRPTNSTSGGSAGSPTCRAARPRSGSRAPRARRARAPPRRARSRRRSRAEPGGARAARARARRASSTSVPQSCTTNGLPVAQRDRARGQPVRVHEVGVAGRAPRRLREGAEHRRHERRLPRRAR